MRLRYGFDYQSFDKRQFRDGLWSIGYPLPWDTEQ